MITEHKSKETMWQNVKCRNLDGGFATKYDN